MILINRIVLIRAIRPYAVTRFILQVMRSIAYLQLANRTATHILFLVFCNVLSSLRHL